MLLFVGVHGALTVEPKNAVVSINHWVIFNCTTTVVKNTVYWQYIPYNGPAPLPMYNGQSFTPKFQAINSVVDQTGTRYYNVRFPPPSMTFAGIYTCQDNGGEGDQQGAILVVLSKCKSGKCSTD